MLKIGFVVVALALGWSGSACTMVSAFVPVGPNFRIRVASEGRPVKGLTLQIAKVQVVRATQAETPALHAALSIVTDRDGFVPFRDMAPGFYSVTVEHDDEWGAGVGIQVERDGPADVTVPMEWPVKRPLAVRSIRGTMRTAGYVSGEPAPTIAVDLLEALTGRLLKSSRTSDTGAFDFSGAAPGFYFLRVAEPLNGRIAVEVDPKARTDHLEIEFATTPCGVDYFDRIHCSAGELRVEQLCGRVADVTDAVIPEATISLYDLSPTPKLIVQTRSKSTGDFSIPTSVTGTFELIITSPGFTPLRQRIHVEASDQTTCSRPLKVQLVVVNGDCSTVQ